MTESLNCERLMEAIADILPRYPNGLSEFELIQALAKQNDAFPAPDFNDPLVLFQHHFVLMHCLYRLQDRWFNQQKSIVSISALAIRMLPFQSTEQQQLSVDLSVKDYYLNWHNLGQENQASIEQLLQNFWQRLLADDSQPQALKTLGLEKNADPITIKQRYQQLASQHHPDKGGDADEFRKIREAYELLCRKP